LSTASVGCGRRCSGANDGIVSTASLIVGVAAAAATQNAVLIAGVAGLVAGAMSMAAGEYVSVSSQSDTERADLARERKELSENVGFEQEELAEIYINRSRTDICASGRSAGDGEGCLGRPCTR
jgi:VIT1/CCC1 family predicted Fe2+/Mn2+ transporter